MWKSFQWVIFILGFTEFHAKDPELPLCPTNIQYFPQNLPMHCRMPTPADLQNIQSAPNQDPTPPPFPPPFYQSPPPGKMPEPIPIPIPPGLPGPMPGLLPGPMPGAMPIPMPLALPGGPSPAHKLPVIVMPFYAPDNSFKKPLPKPRPEQKPRFHIRKRRRPRYYTDTDDSCDTDTSSNEVTDSSSDTDSFWRGRRSGRRSNKHRGHREKRRRHQRQDLLTPVLQYVTKDGYVIFEKKISKGEAKDWLKYKNNDKTESTTKTKQEIDDFDDGEDVDVKTDKDDEKMEIRTEKNTQKIPKRKTFKHKMPKKLVEE